MARDSDSECLVTSELVSVSGVEWSGVEQWRAAVGCVGCCKNT